MVDIQQGRADHNSLGKAGFIMGLLALVLSFVPLVGFVSWLLGPLAVICGGIALFRPKRSLAIAGVVCGVLAIAVCFMWVGMAKGVGEALNTDTFNETNATAAKGDSPIVEATIAGVWADMERNRVAAGQKYGGSRLHFTGETIRDFEGRSGSPVLVFVGAREEYLIHLVSASFSEEDGAAIASLAKGQKVSFVCGDIRESFGDGYNLGDCRLDSSGDN